MKINANQTTCYKQIKTFLFCKNHKFKIVSNVSKILWNFLKMWFLRYYFLISLRNQFAQFSYCMNCIFLLFCTMIGVYSSILYYP